MKFLDIYVDESGLFWGTQDSNGLTVASFAMRERQDLPIVGEQALNSHLAQLGHPGVFHTAPLVHGCDAYATLDIDSRRKLFWRFNAFQKNADVKTWSSVLDLKYLSSPALRQAHLLASFTDFMVANASWLNEFDCIEIFYDDGQPGLTGALREFVKQVNGVTLQITQQHKTSRIFQIADFATFRDKLHYKIDHRLRLSKTELQFFTEKGIYQLIQKHKNQL